MGQKINPIGLRLGVNRTWDSRWFAGGADYAKLLHQDLQLRAWLKERLSAAGVARIIIERPHKKCRVTIYAARPGVVIGKKGADIEKLRKDISARTEGEVHLNIVEVRKPETDAQLIAEGIAQQVPEAQRQDCSHEAVGGGEAREPPERRRRSARAHGGVSSVSAVSFAGVESPWKVFSQ